MPGSADRFVVTDRPVPTLTGRYRPLPESMDISHIIVVPACQVAAGYVVVALFTDGPGRRHALHLEEAFTARPRSRGRCPPPQADRHHGHLVLVGEHRLLDKVPEDLRDIVDPPGQGSPSLPYGLIGAS
jgi:hypothetical protein